jgi:calcineurin-like phosphoesterase family protein
MSKLRVWFTSDHHFGHANIIKYCDRPFKTVGEMDARMVGLWNSVVGIDDVVYHLGDLTLGDVHDAAHYLSQLNGQIKIVPGSHDGRWLSDFSPNVTGWAGHPVEILPPLVSLEFPGLGDEKWPQVIVLCHYAMRVWDRSHYGAWHLYGHSHGRLPGHGKSFDVGVDCMDFTPLSLEQVVEKMRGLPDGRPGVGPEMEEW